MLETLASEVGVGLAQLAVVVRKGWQLYGIHTMITHTCTWFIRDAGRHRHSQTVSQSVRQRVYTHTRISTHNIHLPSLTHLS